MPRFRRAEQGGRIGVAVIVQAGAGGEGCAVGVDAGAVVIGLERNRHRSVGQRHGQNFHVGVVGQSQALHGLGVVDGKQIAEKLGAGRIRASAAGKAVRHGNSSELVGIGRHVNPVAQALNEGRRRAIGISDGERLRGLGAFHAGRQQEQRGVMVGRKRDGLGGALDHVIGIGGAELKWRAVPYLRGTKLPGRISVTAAIQSSGGEGRSIGVNADPVEGRRQGNRRRRVGQGHGQDNDVRVVGQSEALDGLAVVQAEDVSVEVGGRAGIFRAAAGVGISGADGDGFARVIPRRRPQADALRHRDGGSVGVIDSKSLVGLAGIDGGSQQEQSGVLAGGQRDGLAGASDGIKPSSRAEAEQAAIPVWRGAEQIGRIGVAAAIGSAAAAEGDAIGINGDAIKSGGKTDGHSPGNRREDGHAHGHVMRQALKRSGQRHIGIDRLRRGAGRQRQKARGGGGCRAERPREAGRQAGGGQTDATAETVAGDRTRRQGAGGFSACCQHK